MVPLSITLRNFLSYGENAVTLDFSKMHIVCLCGDNGHGKSALLDAITWALWGETRLGKQGHEQLIRIGADEMSVELTFRVGSDKYRVKRQRSRRTSGANWEIQRSDATGAWKPLTGTNSSDTGRIIQQIVRMSYDTFLNAAYLKQGRADEFVRQTSNRRKEILCEILELSRYDRLEEKAKQRAKDAAEAAFDFERQSNQARAIATDVERYRAELTLEEARLHAKTLDLAALSAALRAAEKNCGDLKSQIEQRKTLIAQIKAVDSDIATAEKDQKEVHQRIDRIENLLKDSPAISRDHKALLAARERSTALTGVLRELHDLEIERLNAQKSIGMAEQALRHNSVQLSKEITFAEEQSKAASTVKAQINSATAKLTTLSDIPNRIDDFNRQKIELTGTIAELRVEHDQIDREIKSESARQDRLKDQSESCSICGSPLPPSRIGDLLNESIAHAAAIAQKLEAVRSNGIAKRRLLTEVTSVLTELELSRTERDKLNNDLARLEQRHSQLMESSDRLPQLRIDLAQIESAIKDRSFAQAESKNLAQIEVRLKNLRPLATEYDDLLSQIKNLAGVDTVYQELMSADNNLVSERRSDALLSRHLQSLITQRSEATTALTKTDGAVERLSSAEVELRQVTSEERTSKLAVSEIEKSIGRLERSIEQCADAEEKVKLFEGEREKQRHEESLYKTLIAAFGKRGIQASIIENALPELQQYTNDVLDRLTDGDLRVFIETTRLAKTKNAAPIETLEVKISDSLGTRPLEMYSGGEAFRVSFALRIALSMLLVRRSGAELQTLIIDEGFGTQDAKGREKLIDAINAIKQDFEQILVITHIDELKEAFADRIEVYKTSEGSQLRVVYGDAIG